MDRVRLECAEPLLGLSGVTVGDFWSWAYSNLLSNANRSVFAEFLVATALGVMHLPRIEWDSVDLRYGERKIEVKCSAYIQSWPQVRPSLIKFDIAKKHGWDSGTNVTSVDAVRSADCYVFCLYSEQDRSAANIPNTDAWHFYVMSTKDIDRHFGAQRSITLSRLQPLCAHVKYSQLKLRIDEVLGL